MVTKVDNSEILEAMEYLGIPVTEDLRKGLTSVDLEGAEQNGGDNGDQFSPKEVLSKKIEKAKKELEDLEKEEMEFKKSQSSEVEEEDELEEGEEGFKKSQEIEVLEKTVSSQSILLKSQFGLIDQLTKAVEKLDSKFEDFLETPLERRSAEGVTQLQKSMHTEEVRSEGQFTQRVSVLEKGKVSNILMGIYTESGSSNPDLADTITTYEASGYLPESAVSLIKSKGIEVIR